jgi:hypothetical protein
MGRFHYRLVILFRLFEAVGKMLAFRRAFFLIPITAACCLPDRAEEAYGIGHGLPDAIQIVKGLRVSFGIIWNKYRR